MEALRHWAMHGREPEQQTQRVKKDDWKVLDFEQPITSLWDVPLAPGTLDRFLIGFQPSAMEDKWFIYSEGPDEKGWVSVHLVRSWTGFPVAVIRILARPKDEGGPSTDREPGSIVDITWESSGERIQGATEAGSKQTASDVCRWIFGVELAPSAVEEEDDTPKD